MRAFGIGFTIPSLITAIHLLDEPQSWMQVWAMIQLAVGVSILIASLLPGIFVARLMRPKADEVEPASQTASLTQNNPITKAP
jgi:hypothetical protein